MRLQDGVNTVNQGLYQRFWKIVRGVPDQNGVKLVFRVRKVFFEESVHIEGFSSFAVPDHIALILAGANDVFCEHPHAKIREKGDIRRRRGSKIENAEFFFASAFQAPHELSQSN